MIVTSGKAIRDGATMSNKTINVTLAIILVILIGIITTLGPEPEPQVVPTDTQRAEMAWEGSPDCGFIVAKDEEEGTLVIESDEEFDGRKAHATVSVTESVFDKTSIGDRYDDGETFSVR